MIGEMLSLTKEELEIDHLFRLYRLSLRTILWQKLVTQCDKSLHDQQNDEKGTRNLRDGN